MSQNTGSKMNLVIVRGLSQGKIFPLELGENLIGRWDPDKGAFPEIDLEPEDVEAKVSRKHAIIIRDSKRIFIKDLGSLNGTFVNRGERLKAEQEHDLKAGDEIIVGKIFMRLEVASS